MISSGNFVCLPDCDNQTELQTEVEGVADVGQQERRLGQGGDQHQPGEYQGGGWADVIVVSSIDMSLSDIMTGLDKI